MDKLTFSAYCNEPAFPCSIYANNGNTWEDKGYDRSIPSHTELGLTRLEYFAGLFIQKLPSDTDYQGTERKREMQQAIYFAEDYCRTLYVARYGPDDID